MRVAAAALLALLATGCAAPAGPDRTGGLNLELDIRDFGNFAALYHVRADGTLGWGGGNDARDGKVSWKGVMNDQEIQDLRRMLEEAQWFAPPPPEPGDAAHSQRTTTVRLDGPDLRCRLTVKGHDVAIDGIIDFLSKIARRRYDTYLQDLPAPQEPPPDAPAPAPEAQEDRATPHAPTAPDL